MTALALAGGGLGVALADTGSSAPTILCPDVAVALPSVPASARAEVDRNLALLRTQINEANTRLAKSAGEGGPAFVQNAILGPLTDKRTATIDRIAISIGRTTTKPTGLNVLAECSLRNGAGGGGAAATTAPPAPTTPAAPTPPAGEEAGGQADGGATTGAIICPTVADRLPAVPARAADEVARNLALLERQIDEANARLASSVGQGGPAFVQNAILGPLEDKRFATVNRIATAIGRVAERPAGLEVLAPCTLGG